MLTNSFGLADPALGHACPGLVIAWSIGPGPATRLSPEQAAATLRGEGGPAFARAQRSPTALDASHVFWSVPALGTPGRAVRVAVNHALAAPHQRLAANDELALLPPVTGG